MNAFDALDVFVALIVVAVLTVAAVALLRRHARNATFVSNLSADGVEAGASIVPERRDAYHCPIGSSCFATGDGGCDGGGAD